MNAHEGCVCGHGSYSHAWPGAYAMRSGKCSSCECKEFRRVVVDEEFGLSLDPCEHPSINGGVCAVCGSDQ